MRRNGARPIARSVASAWRSSIAVFAARGCEAAALTIGALATTATAVTTDTAVTAVTTATTTTTNTIATIATVATIATSTSAVATTNSVRVFVVALVFLVSLAFLGSINAISVIGVIIFRIDYRFPISVVSLFVVSVFASTVWIAVIFSIFYRTTPRESDGAALPKRSSVQINEATIDKINAHRRENATPHDLRITVRCHVIATCTVHGWYPF